MIVAPSWLPAERNHWPQRADASEAIAQAVGWGQHCLRLVELQLAVAGGARRPSCSARTNRVSQSSWRACRLRSPKCNNYFTLLVRLVSELRELVPSRSLARSSSRMVFTAALAHLPLCGNVHTCPSSSSTSRCAPPPRLGDEAESSSGKAACKLLHEVRRRRNRRQDGCSIGRSSGPSGDRAALSAAPKRQPSIRLARGKAAVMARAAAVTAVCAAAAQPL